MKKSKYRNPEITKTTVELAVMYLVSIITLIMTIITLGVADQAHRFPEKAELFRGLTNPMFLVIVIFMCAFIFTYCIVESAFTIWEGRNHLPDVFDDKE